MGVEALSSAVSGLFAHRRRLDVISHNVANSNTIGYSRQRVDLVSASGAGVGIHSGSSQSLGGVEVAGITRSRDSFLESRSLEASGSSAKLVASHDVLMSVEALIGEPSDHGIIAGLDAMWGAFDDLANFPDALPQREAAIQSAVTVAGRLNEIDRQLRQLHETTKESLQSDVARVNALTSEIATLNEAISAVATDLSPNDLLDQRDLAASSLAQLVGARTRTRADGSMDVYLGNTTLVQGSRTFAVEVAETTDATLSPLGFQRVGLEVAGLVTVTDIAGSLGGKLDGLNGTVPDSINSLNEVAQQLIDNVNDSHQDGEDLNGATGGPFFDGSDAGTISVSTGIQSDARLVAAAGPSGGTRDGSNAADIANLRSSTTGADATAVSFVATLGLTAQAVGQRASAESDAFQRVEEARLTARSVNVEEEMVDLIEAQRSYEAAARVVSTIDQMLDTLVNRLGVVGR
ncbi:MAG: flagellar hook-associated protein FlgK [Ilumatobacteraceae bacterium]